MAISIALSRVHVSLHTPRARCRAGSVALRPLLAWVPRASNAEDASPSAAAATPVRTTHSAFACPVCGGATRRAVYASGSASLRCAAGHASDVAKEGHVNLLLRRAKGGGWKKKATGDTNEMVAARRAFLDAGHYSAAAETVAVTVARYLVGRARDAEDDEVDARLAGGVDAGSGGEEEDALSRTRGDRDASRNASRKNKTSARARRLDANKRRDARAKADRRAATAERSAHEREDTLRANLPLVVDFGCGEGYWLGKVAERGDIAARFAGVDASPFAAKAAARRLRGAGVPAEIAVGDAQQDLVFSDETVDVALSVFAPRNVAELARVVKKGGLVIVVSPGDAHLAELRVASRRADASDALFGGSRVLDAAADKRAAVLERFTGGDTYGAFEVVDELEHAGVMRLTRKDVASLLGMGPSAFHREGSSASSDGERLESSGADGAEKMDVTRAFVVQTFRRT